MGSEMCIRDSGEGAEVELSAASAAVARVPPLLRSRWRRRRCCQQQRRARQHGSNSAGSSAKCHRCGQRGHIARNYMVPSPVASGGEQGHSSAARQQRPPRAPGLSWCWRGGIFRGSRIFAIHFRSAAAPGFEDQSRVLRIGVGWSGSTTDCAGGREFHHRFGAGGGDVGAVSSSAGRDTCCCTGGEFNK